MLFMATNSNQDQEICIFQCFVFAIISISCKNRVFCLNIGMCIFVYMSRYNMYYILLP